MEDHELLPSDPSERRKVQNRNAQRNFRNRRHRHQVNQALQLHGTIPPAQPLSWPPLYDSQVLAASNLPSPPPPPPRQPHYLAPQCDTLPLSQQPQVSSEAAYGDAMMRTSENAANQANDTVFSTSASDSDPMVNDAVFLSSVLGSERTAMSYLPHLGNASPMFDHDIGAMPTSAFPIPMNDRSNHSTVISMPEPKSIRPTASNFYTIQVPYSTLLPPPDSNLQGDFYTDRVAQQSPESRETSPDHADRENNNYNSSSSHTSPASSNPTDSEVSKNDDTMSVLHIASHRGHTAIVSILLTHNLDPNEPDGSGRPPLHLAAMNGHTTVTSLLLSRGACINARDALGRTALHWAVLRGHEAVVAVFLDAGGADLNLRDHSDWSVLHVAVERGYEDTLRMLLRHGADLTLRARKCEGWERGQREVGDESKRERVMMMMEG